MTDLDDLNNSESATPHFDRIHDDNYVLNEQKRILMDSRDAFGKLIADGTRNVFDFPSHHNFSSERLRLFENGTRINLQYTTDSRFSDEPDIWRLSPNAGDDMHIESAESTEYLVNYVIDASHSFKVNQSLQDGDVYRFGAFNGSDGWVVEQRGSDHTDIEVDLVEYRNGTRTVLEADAELPRPITEWQRYQLNYNWYNVGAQVWRQTFTENGKQFNDIFAQTSKDGERGPLTGNLNLWTEIIAGPSTDNLELEVGSLGAIILGTPKTVSRAKPQPIEVSPSGTNDTWEPVYAFRINPNNKNVNALFKKLNIISYSANATIEIVLVGFEADRTDILESDWGEIDYQHDYNTALQDTTNVSEVPNVDGTQKVLAAGEKFGGYTMASAINVNGGNVSGSDSSTTAEVVDRNNILSSDHYIVLARTNSTGSLWFTWKATQSW